jgi:hypothetical protein
VVSYSGTRAKKDQHNRARGLHKLERALAKGKLTKQHINNRGYNKYLQLEGHISITIDYDKYNDDAKWDGLKGYLTNTALSKESVIETTVTCGASKKHSASPKPICASVLFITDSKNELPHTSVSPSVPTKCIKNLNVN